MGKSKFQEVLEGLLEKNNLLKDFYDAKYSEVSITFGMSNFDDLVISRKEKIVSAGHYYLHKENRIPDPMLAFVLQDKDIWYPHMCELAIGYTTVCSKYMESIDKNYPTIISVNRAMVEDIKVFTDIFAENIKCQGWFDIEPKLIVCRDSATITI